MERIGKSRRLVFWPLVLLLCGLWVAYYGAAMKHHAEEEQRRESLRAELEPIGGSLSRELFSAIHLMEGIAGFVAIEGGIADPQFHALAAELMHSNDLIRNVAVAPDNVVRLVHPEKGNEQVIGFDYSTVPDQWPSVVRMMNERRLVVAGPVALVQGGVGIIGRRPIYVPDPPGQSENRRYWGLVSTVLEFDRLLARTPMAEASERLTVALRGVDGLGARGKTFWGDASVFEASPVVVDVPLPSGSWQLAAIPRGGWPPFRPLKSPAFLGGSALSFVLAALLLRLLQAGDAWRREVGERRQAEEQVRRLHEELQRHAAELERRVTERTAELAVARDRAEAADRTKSAFLATMSHELRTPLNSIIGFTGLLLQGLAGPMNAEQTKQLGMVKDSGQHLLALINDVLDISKIEADQIEITSEAFDLTEALYNAVQKVTPWANKRRLPLITRIAPGVGSITSDRRRVEQIVLNLLSNAIKFTEQGQITLTAEITPSTSPVRPSEVRISVADTGLGIQREDLGKLFQPFRQLDTGLTRQHEGTGLGLAICKRLVERLGGTIAVESEWGKGSTFHVTLPIHPEGEL
jgi:signal transduction histidine kinase